MNNFEVIIGIEVHVQLNTKTKMFSNSLNDSHHSPNTLINEIDLGMPGVLPQPNLAAIEKSLCLANLLAMEVNYSKISFDRKNYFYQDLPKGFQITQQFHPIGQHGKLTLANNKVITIQRIHMEEDTAKQHKIDNGLLMDYNRAGCPLVEIVSDPVIANGLEAVEYLTELRRLLKLADISDAKMEDGSMRADVNISLRPYGYKKYGTKVEIKNINSISNVAKAIDFEIKRQYKELTAGQKIVQATRRFDDKINETVFMREKTDAVDYHYMTEPNIIPISLTEKQYQNAIKKTKYDWREVRQDFIDLGFNLNQTNLIIDNYDLLNLFTSCIKFAKDATWLYNFLTTELTGACNKKQIAIESLVTNQLDNLKLLITKVGQDEINGKQSKALLEVILDNDKLDLNNKIKELGFIQIKDPEQIKQFLISSFANNKNMLNQYNERPDRVKKFFLGQLMKDTNGQANPIISNQILDEIIENYI